MIAPPDVGSTGISRAFHHDQSWSKTIPARGLRDGRAVAVRRSELRAETLDQLYEKAKFEKTLVFYPVDRLYRTRTGPRSSCRNTPASQCR